MVKHLVWLYQRRHGEVGGCLSGENRKGKQGRTQGPGANILVRRLSQKVEMRETDKKGKSIESSL